MQEKKDQQEWGDDLDDEARKSMDKIKRLEYQEEVKKGIAIIKQNHEGVVARLNQISKEKKLKT